MTLVTAPVTKTTTITTSVLFSQINWQINMNIQTCLPEMVNLLVGITNSLCVNRSWKLTFCITHLFLMILVNIYSGYEDHNSWFYYSQQKREHLFTKNLFFYANTIIETKLPPYVST